MNALTALVHLAIATIPGMIRVTADDGGMILDVPVRSVSKISKW